MFDKERFIEDCRTALGEHSPREAVTELLERVLARPGEVEKAVGTPSEAGVETLFSSDDLTVLNLVWGPEMTLYPHDHRMWAVIGIYGGREDNRFYRRADGTLNAMGTRTLETGDTIPLGDSIIHAVTNPLPRLTGAIHVYGGDFFGVPRSEFDPDTLEERPYDVENLKAAFAKSNDRWHEIQAGS